jgi:hypothetical protein
MSSRLVARATRVYANMSFIMLCRSPGSAVALHDSSTCGKAVFLMNFEWGAKRHVPAARIRKDGCGSEGSLSTSTGGGGPSSIMPRQYNRIEPEYNFRNCEIFAHKIKIVLHAQPVAKFVATLLLCIAAKSSRDSRAQTTVARAQNKQPLKKRVQLWAVLPPRRVARNMCRWSARQANSKDCSR